MACPKCGSSAPFAHGRCRVCGTKAAEADDVGTPTVVPVPDVDATSRSSLNSAGTPDTDETLLVESAQTSATSLPSTRFGDGTVAFGAGHTSLRVGEDFGERYHIIRVLGTGGMGAVYQAWDKVLETAVAMKVIRPETAATPQQAEAIEKRFKRELLLARQVTHRNVVRIHDLGALHGVTYITMPYVHGSDLATVLKREGRLPVPRALHIARQVAEGLSAAHEAGVIHRDLKPANVMIDENDHALIMDFGIARSTEPGTGPAMTATGGVVGTVEYMAPEQARAEGVDQRCDIYSFGLILYDILSGGRHGSHTTAVAGLVARLHHPPALLRTIDPTIPEWLEGMVNKCLHPDPNARYQTLTELLADLDHAHGPPPTATAVTMPGATLPTPIAPAPRGPALRWLVAGAMVAIIAVGLWTQRARFTAAPEPPPTTRAAAAIPVLSLAVLPFRNASADSTIDSLGPVISQVLTTSLGQSEHVRTVPADRLSEVLTALRLSATATLSPAELKRVADLTNAKRVLWGQYARFGDQIRIDATLQDLERQETVLLNALAANEAGMLTALNELGDSVGKELGRESPDIVAALKASSWKPSTNSSEALRLYYEGVRQSQQGAHKDALTTFQAAVKADEHFALAFSAMARAYASLGYEDEAGQHSRTAMGLADALPPQEKYQIAANHYRLVRDVDKAIEANENLAKASPNSASTQYDLGVLYEQVGRLEEARQHFVKVVELDPKFVEGLLWLGRVDIRQGRFQESLQPLNDALTLAIQLNRDESRANVLQAIGIAYKNLNRLDEALPRYQQSLEIKQKAGNKGGMASSLSEIAQVYTRQGRLKEAEQSYRSALQLQEEIRDRAGTSTTLANLASLLTDQLGRPDDALPLLRRALQLRRDAGNRLGEAFVLNALGTAHMAKGDFVEAVTNLEQALAIREKGGASGDLAVTLHNLGETHSRLGRYDAAIRAYVASLDNYKKANNRRGAAMESYSIGTVFDTQGRFGAATQSKQEALTAFRDLQVRDIWLSESLSGVGFSLSSSGRFDEARKHLDEALTVARELKNQRLIAQALKFQATNAFYEGNTAEAAKLADQAAQAAKQSADKELLLQANILTTFVAASTQPSRTLAARLGTLAQEAETLGLKALGVEAAIERAHTLLKSGDSAAARQEIDRAFARADTLALKSLLAKAHYTRGMVLAAAGDPQARNEYTLALRLLNELRAEEGNQNILKRADLSAIYAACERGAKGD
jgi:tetratricopeptide (TPR) repeat protein